MEEEGCVCGETKCYKGGECYYNKFCQYDLYRYGYEACDPAKSYNAVANKNGTCRTSTYLYDPYLYSYQDNLGLKCLKDKCPCGKAMCNKDHFCVEPVRCIYHNIVYSTAVGLAPLPI